MTAADQVTVTGHAEDVPFQTLARTVVVITREEIQRLPAELNAATDLLPLLSKYVLEYAKQTAAFSVSAGLPAHFSIGQRAEYKIRRDGTDYWLVDTRVGRTVGVATLFVEGSNLLNTRYQEISGVDMPGRWVRAGVRLGSHGDD